MPPNADSRRGSHLREHLLFLLLLLTLNVFAPPALAQNAPPAPADKSEQQKAAYAALADLLQDDKARAALINHLKQAAGDAPATAPTTPEESTPATLSDSLNSLAQEGIGTFNQKLGALQKLIDSGPKRVFNPAGFFRALGYFLLTVAVTFALFHLIRRLIAPLYKRMGSWGHNARLQRGPWYKRPAAILGAFAVDLLVLLLALAAGNLFARHVHADSATILRLQTLFLSAFAVIEFFKAVLRLIFAPNFDYLRPFPFSDQSARYWNTRLAWLSGLIGYGLMVVVPVVAVQISYPAAAAVNLVVMLALTLYAIWLILHNRKPIQQQINLLAERSMAFFSAILRGLGHIWHLLAIAYFLVLFVLSQFDIGNSLRFMMSATVKSLLVVGVGALLSGMLTRWIFRRISLPTDVNLRYPMLERRINSYIPNGLKILRVMVVLAVTLFLLDAWHLINLYQWAGSENGQRTLGGLVHILLILLIAVFSWTLMASIIEHRLALELSNGVRPSARERTLLTLFRNVLAIVISTITVMIVLSQVGLNIAPLLAGAGALGLAISFGAQTLVKDVITGVFIQFENGMNTGEYVTVSGITGTVERMTIRSIGLRDDYGVYHIVPYSSITTLANYAREFGVYRANYTVSRDEDIDRVNEVLHQAVAALKQDEQVKHFLIGEPVFNGVVALGDRSFTTRVTVRTQALKQWVVQYALDRLVKIHFDRAGIGMPQQAMQISRAPQLHEEQAPPSVPGG
ncbi:TPA: mechanosensitive channel protein [Serratia marcescens]|uniref:mechanosensitive channel protein n=1 Tax=Serratia TaxID=613 RepID=UPI001A2CBDEA|nr:mechanosensitive channel protein [Serratia marcescens]MDP8619530.1 mechanosensitive channel protein [Serratia marcescens]HAT2906639.1 mechanosensitive channel protein [Serratia marcescens]